MSVKSEVVKILEGNRGAPVSGETLAARLGVSRTAVWKAVGALKDEGYPIDGAPKRGYVLSDSSSVLSREAVLAGITALNPDAGDSVTDISVLRSIDSTNAEAKRRVAEAAELRDIPYGSVIVADKQTAGRGRRGRSFFSPAADSVYMSFVLKPAGVIENSFLITIMAAVAVCRAVERMTDASGNINTDGTATQQNPGIKWVNDIFINNRKICGILTEAVSDVESGVIESLVLGIGVNINVPEADFPAEIRDIAGSLHIDPGKRGLFAATLISEVFSLYSTLADGNTRYIIREYRAWSLMKGRNITVIKGDEERVAVACGIANDGSLKVEYADGTRENLRSGEVSIGL
jgi:BirA family biotin operon repressor/biotin-[acetyl-CoA-carboxylase] ligase